MTRIIENEIVLNDEAFQMENVIHLVTIVIDHSQFLWSHRNFEYNQEI